MNSKILILIVGALAATSVAAAGESGDITVIGATATPSWIWAADGVKMLRAAGGDRAGFPIEKDGDKPGQAVAKIEVSEAPAGGVFHSGFPLNADWKVVDISDFAEKGVLEFSIKGSAGDEDFYIGLADARPKEKPDHHYSKVKLSDFGKVTKEWTIIRIPLKDILDAESKADPKRIAQVEICAMAGKAKMSVSLCEMKIVKKSSAQK